MVKKLLILVVVSPLFSESSLERNCLNCHREEKIPSELIYRRYLTQYSTHRAIKKRLFIYLKNPQKIASVMPKQFFLKFPEKKSLDLNSSLLEKSIDDYLEHFDLKKQLKLSK